MVYYSLYKINTKSLTASCCENKTTDCNAHCYLEKKMNQEDGNKKKGTTAEIKLKISEYIVNDYLSDLYPDRKNKFYITTNFQTLKDYSPAIDHPPQA
jgi:hypothetical protein